ncbi:MAG: hypothetical protein ACR2KJ_17030 [Jatrophihabitans sp.]
MNTAIDEAMRALRDADPTAGDQLTTAHPGVLSIIGGAADDFPSDSTGARRRRARPALSIAAAAACVAVLATVGLAPGAVDRRADQQANQRAASSTAASTAITTAPRVPLRVADLTDPSAFRRAAAARGLRVTVKVLTGRLIAVPLFPGTPSSCRPDQRYPEWTRVGIAVTFPKGGPIPTDGSIRGDLHIVLVNVPPAMLSDPQAVLFWLDSTPVPITVTILSGPHASVAISAPTSSCTVP